jgi:hypothetical protein
MSTNTGGPAFPHESGALMHNGMTLRDYFAAKAMQGFAASESEQFSWTSESAADRAYEWADAMLKARNES